MGTKTKIEWTDGGSTWTPIRARNLKTGKVGWHCEHATTGCAFCYAEGMNKRLGTGLPFKPGHRKDIEIFLDEKMLLAPLRWKRPRKIFVGSMTDLFADFVTDGMLDRIFAVMALCPQHTFQCLTKRAERMRDYVHAAHERIASTAMEEAPVGRDLKAAGLIFAPREKPSTFFERWPLTNVWLGVSAERQQEADERIPLLLQTPAAVRFISAEPLLGPIDLHQAIFRGSHMRSNIRDGISPAHLGLDWVIVGGESSRSARPMHPQWARDLRDECVDAGAAFHFKQWGEWTGMDDKGWLSAAPTVVRIIRPDGSERTDGDQGAEDAVMFRVGKKAAGRLLDGIEHNAFPQQTETAHVDPD